MECSGYGEAGTERAVEPGSPSPILVRAPVAENLPPTCSPLARNHVHLHPGNTVRDHRVTLLWNPHPWALGGKWVWSQLRADCRQNGSSLRCNNSISLASQSQLDPIVWG